MIKDIVTENQPSSQEESSEFKIASYIKFDYSRYQFINSYTNPKSNYKIAFGLKDEGASKKPEVLIFEDLADTSLPPHFDSAIVFGTNNEELEKLKIYLDNNKGTELLFAVLGNAVNNKKESDHIILIIASENFTADDLFVLDKGERVAKGGEKVSITDKGGERVVLR